jgi:hypothetical protein
MLRWVLPLLLVSNVAQAQQDMPCRPSEGTAACPGTLVCNAEHRCVEAPPFPHAEAMRNSGMVLTLVGSGVLTTAIVFFARSKYCGFLFASKDDDCNRGFGFLIGSLPLLGIGIPFWAVGQHRLNQYPQRAELFITPVEGGAVAGVRLINF